MNRVEQNASRLAGLRSEDYFFIAMATVIVATVFLGFAKSYFLAGMFGASLPTRLIHLHGAIFTCWILLFVAQVALVSARRLSWHKQLGVLGMGLASVMLVVGIATLFKLFDAA